MVNKVAKYISSTEFKSLLDYYISCLEKEDLLSLTFNFKSDGKKFYSNIFQKEEFFHGKKEQVILEKSENLDSFFQNYKLVQNNKSLFYGYPIVMDSGGKVSPIFFTELLYEEKDDKIIFTKVSVNPEFNHYILAQNGFELEEINKIHNELDEEDNFLSKLESILEILNFSNVSVSSSLDPKKLEIDSNLQLVNKAMLYSGERTGIIYGLLVELQKLKRKSFDECESSSLNCFLDCNSTNIAGENTNKNLLEVFQLNDSQEESTLSALTKPITVVTGPPGTGKSQVVLNIIANAVYNDKTVLFASKNNKAVDVVIEKLNAILTEKLIIRMGHRFHRRNAKSGIDNLFLNKNSIRVPSDFEKNISNLENVNSEINSIKEQLKLMSELNNNIDDSQNKMNSFIEQLPKDLYDICKDDSYEEIDKFTLESKIKNLFVDNIGIFRKIMNKIFPTIYRKKQQELFQNYYNTLNSSFKKYLDKHITLETEHIEKALRWILFFKQIEILKEDISSAKDKLAEFPSIYELKNRLGRFHSERIKLSRSIFENYWLKKIKNTEIDDQNHISRYFDASEKLETWIEERSLWEQLLSDQEYAIQEILSFLPVWVVTNLSAKNSLPLKCRLFDLLIIDEASQCDIASALPLMYRAKQVTIIGDPKQLKHISILRESQDKSIASEKNIENLFLDFSYTKNSLYDLAERTIKEKNELPILLNEHYRSHPDIISFSNKYFYERKLNILTDENNLISEKYVKKRISWNDVKGKTVHSKSPYCIEEADKVVDQVIELLEKFHQSNLKNVSFGIVTLFRAQMELIIEKIKKIEHLKDMNITVGTAHRFQGDEKDIIIFSPAISEGVKRNTLNWIHSTNQLLNVAITRAKSGLIIVGDKQKCSEAKGLLGDLVEYVETNRTTEINFDSSIERVLYDELVKNGIKITPQYWIKIKDKKPYRLDFALFINSRKYDIEIDGDKAHSQSDDYDILRDTHLRMEGWKVRRFQANEIQNNLAGVVEEIKRLY